MPVSVIILAAGQGTRMRSTRPKPLHRICGRSLLMHVIHALSDLQPERVAIVVGHGAEEVTKRVHEQAPPWAQLYFAEQPTQRGTGDAARIGLAAIPSDDLDDDSTLLIVPGDTPLLRPGTLDELVATHVANGNAATLLASVKADPTGYGRVIRASDSRVLRVVEQGDASPDELDVHEINTSIYAFRRDLLGPALRRISPDNAQGEYYLTDVISVLAEMGHRIGCVQAPAEETQGVNDRWQLALAERELRARTNRQWLLNGVTMFDPRQTFIDVDVQLGRDVTLLPGTMLEGRTTIGDRCEIGPETRLTDCVVGDRATVANTVGMEAEIGVGSRVGPFAYLPSGSSVPPGTVTGAFYTAGVDEHGESSND